MHLLLRVPALAVGATLVLVSCAGYPDRVAPALAAFEGGSFETAAELFSDNSRTDSEFLSGAEAGMCWLAAGEWQRAVAEFERSVVAISDFEDRGALALESGLEAATSLLINETAKSYLGEGFERLAVHATLGLAYLAQGDLDGLRVETRRADRMLTTEEELYETKYAAGGLASFLSATAFLLEENRGDALIDYMRMLDREVGVELAGPECLRLATALGRADLVADLEQRFEPTPVPEGDTPPAWVVVIGGIGQAPVKVEMSISLPTPSGFVSFAAPQFVSRESPIEALRILAEPEGLAATTLGIENVDSVARQNLDDRLGVLALRSAARNAARLAVRKSFKDDNNHSAAALMDVWTLFSERADLRCWTSLPAEWQAVRMALEPGIHDFELVAVGGDRGRLGTYELLPGETLFVLARTIGQNVYAYPIGGGRLDDPVEEVILQP